MAVAIFDAVPISDYPYRSGGPEMVDDGQ